MQVYNNIRDGSTIGAEAVLWAPLSTLEVRSGESGTFLQPKLEFEWSEPPIHSRKIHSTLKEVDFTSLHCSGERVE